jgi:alkaline phosphatase D
MPRPATARCARRSLSLLALTVGACRGPGLPSPSSGPHLTHGIAVGEVTATAAVFWGRCDRATTLRVRLEGDTAERTAAVGAASDFTGRIALAPLAPDARYAYRAGCGGASADADVSGSSHRARPTRRGRPLRLGR